MPQPGVIFTAGGRPLADVDRGRSGPPQERWAYVPGLIGTPRKVGPRFFWALVVGGAIAMGAMLVLVILW
jgi:hypothetical protein